MKLQVADKLKRNNNNRVIFIGLMSIPGFLKLSVHVYRLAIYQFARVPKNFFSCPQNFACVSKIFLQ